MKGMIYVNNSYNPCPCSYCMEYPCPYWVNASRYNSDFSDQFADQYPSFTDEIEYEPTSDFSEPLRDNDLLQLKDYGPEPFVINIDKATKQNDTYRTALWTGKHLQLTLMSIKPGEDIGLEIHPNLDQFIRIEEGQGIVKMGNRKDKLDFQQKVYDDFAFIIPAGTWHNLINTGNKPIKLYSIYAPPQHPRGTVQKTKAAAQAGEDKHNR